MISPGQSVLLFPMQEKKLLFDAKSSIKNKFLRFCYGIIAKPFESFMGMAALNKAYFHVQDHPDGNFFDRALASLDVTYEIDEEDLKKIPANGPLIIVSNHPLGGLDGIILGSVLLRVREDSKLIVNELLTRMSEIEPYVITVNAFGGKKAMAQNVAAMKETIRHLKNGGCVGTFPSGTVSYLHRDFCISDPDWNTNIASIAKRTGANILPIYFEARNSWLFYAAGVIHPMLRTMLLPRELIRISKICKKRPAVRMYVGSVVPARKVSDFKTDEDLISWLRISSYILGGRDKKGEPQSFSQARAIQKSIEKFLPKIMQKEMQELILPVSPDKMAEEVESLPESACMIRGDKISVYCAEAWQIKRILVEIGRLREKTFREVGEGTGKSFDIDEFDQYYLHMFMWDHENKAIVGAYRIGRTDKIVNAMGVQGLYASTLFRMKPELIAHISPALEMGRSFIASEYQKKRSTLAILWRGIGEYIYRNPRYKTLYGPVSISTDYHSISKDLIVQFLTEHKTDEELAKFVKAKKPPKVRLKNAERKALSGSLDIEHISALVSEVEIDNKGLPTLLKHYLKLDGQLLAFNVDHDFGSCIDGLIMVDLMKTDVKLLKSYMGAEQAEEYRKSHGGENPESAEPSEKE